MKLPIKYNEVHWKVRKEAREQYTKEQDGKCYYCKCDLNGPCAQEVREKEVSNSLFPTNFFNNPIHLHHSHDTGLTIGSVHAYCNAVLWVYEGE
jgi:hypothetical protein